MTREEIEAIIDSDQALCITSPQGKTEHNIVFNHLGYFNAHGLNFTEEKLYVALNNTHYLWKAVPTLLCDKCISAPINGCACLCSYCSCNCH